MFGRSGKTMGRRVFVAGERESRWAEMSHEILGMIFERIPADEVARAVSFVCRSWREVLLGPYCWSKIDIEEWCRRVNRSDVIDFAIRKLVRRSKGDVSHLNAFKIGNSSFCFIAEFSKRLELLKIPMSGVTDKMVERHVASFASLTVLDISFCVHITSIGIEAIGRHCKSLVYLKRNMPLPDFDPVLQVCLKKVDDSEAMAVAESMPNLIHLELSYGPHSDVGLQAILLKCKSLTYLDIQGCWNVDMEGDLEERSEAIKDFRPPWHGEDEETSESDDSGHDDDCIDEDDDEGEYVVIEISSDSD